MTSRKYSRWTRLILVAVVASLALAAAPSLQAQSQACVYLVPGAGYAAWMRVVSGSFASEWSSSFAIGQYRCVSLAPIANGSQFTVQVSAVLGSSKVPCTPSLTRATDFTGNVTYHAWGTTLNVSCVMPGIGVKGIDESPQPTKAGLDAAAKVKAEGDKLKPPADDKPAPEKKKP